MQPRWESAGLDLREIAGLLLGRLTSAPGGPTTSLQFACPKAPPFSRPPQAKAALSPVTAPRAPSLTRTRSAVSEVRRGDHSSPDLAAHEWPGSRS